MLSVTRFNSIVVLTGAGISAESGVKTFRDNNGLWKNHRFEDVATPEAFAANPALVQRFYNERRRQLLHEVIPNEAHRALAQFQTSYSGKLTLITQNVDDLHERAGSRQVLHMHGELLKMRCSITSTIYPCHDDIAPQTICGCCGKPNRLRPHIVWFGEMPFFMEQIQAALRNCDLFIAIGTSGHVYPAAGFVELAKSVGATTVELNLAPTTSTKLFDHSVPGMASNTVPQFFLPGLDQEFS